MINPNTLLSPEEIALLKQSKDWKNYLAILSIWTQIVLGFILYAIWPSVLNEDPFEKEERTYHEALPIEKGIKYAANLWLHMFNFHGPFSLTCTG